MTPAVVNVLFRHLPAGSRAPNSCSPPWTNGLVSLCATCARGIKSEHALTCLLTKRPELPPFVGADHTSFSKWSRLVRVTARAHWCSKRFKCLAINHVPNSKIKPASYRASDGLKPFSALRGLSGREAPFYEFQTALI